MNSGNTKRYLVVSLIGAIVVCLIALVTLMAWEVLYRHSERPAIRAIVSIVPIPAGRVGTRIILYRDYLKHQATVKRFLASAAAKDQPLALPDVAHLDQSILEKLLVEAAMDELALQRKVAVSEGELRAAFTDIIAAASSTTPDIGVYLLDNFGWTEEDFRQQVLRPALLEQKLGQLLAADQNGNPDALSDYLTVRMKKSDVARYLKF